MARMHDPRVRQLADMEVLAGTTSRERAEMSALMTQIVLAEGTALCRQGEAAREAFFVLDGQVAVSCDNSALSVVGCGGLIGEMGLVGRQLRTATATALTDVTVLVMSAGEFSSLLHLFPHVQSLVTALARVRRDELSALQDA